jgi:hypothetical protein
MINSDGYRKYFMAFASHPLPSEFHQSLESILIALWALEEASRIVMSSLREVGEISSPLYHVRDKKLKRDDDVYDLGRDIEIPNKFDISTYFDPICVEPLGSQSMTSSPVTP